MAVASATGRLAAKTKGVYGKHSSISLAAQLRAPFRLPIGIFASASGLTNTVTPRQSSLPNFRCSLFCTPFREVDSRF